MADDAGGSIFEGKKFWVAQRVPTRSTFCNAIRAHGGTTVILEGNADYLIADHARPHAAPVGSISWKWIEASIKQGSLADVEAHRAGPIEGYIRPPGSSRPAKGGREKFTDADDFFLWKWVKDAERKGAALKGNAIYAELEAANSRHTSQSWRDRWIKYVSMRPPPAGADEAQPPQSAPKDSTKVSPSTAPGTQSPTPESRTSNTHPPTPPPPASTAPARQTLPVASESTPTPQGASATTTTRAATDSPPASSRPVFRIPKPLPVSSFTTRISAHDETPRADDDSSSDETHSKTRTVESAEEVIPEDTSKASPAPQAQIQGLEDDLMEDMPLGSIIDQATTSLAEPMVTDHIDTIHERYERQDSTNSDDNTQRSQQAQGEPNALTSQSPPALRRTSRKTKPVNYKLRLSLAAIDNRPSAKHSPDVQGGSQSNREDSPPPTAPQTEEQTASAFSDEERKFLWFEANNLVCAMSENPEEYQKAWAAVSEKFPAHSADEWQDCWEQEVLPDIKRNKNVRKAVTGINYVRLPVSRRASAHFLAETTPDRSAATRARHSAGAALDTAPSQPLSASSKKQVRFGGDLDASDTQQSIESDTLPNGELITKQETQEPDEGSFRSAMKRRAPSEEHERRSKSAPHDSHLGKKRKTHMASLVSDDDSERDVDTDMAILQNGDFSIYQDDGLVEDDKENVRSSPMRTVDDDLNSSDRLIAFGDEQVDFELVSAEALSERAASADAVEEPGTQDSGLHTTVTGSQPSQHAPPRSNRIVAEATLGSPPVDSRSESPSSDVFIDAAQTQSDLQNDTAYTAQFESAGRGSTKTRWQDTQAFLEDGPLEPDLDLPSPPPEPGDDLEYLPSIEHDAKESRHAADTQESESLFVSQYEDVSPSPEGNVELSTARLRKTATHHDSSPPIPDDMEDGEGRNEEFIHSSIQTSDEVDDRDDEFLTILPTQRTPRVETQAFLNADTQDVDLTLPLPASSIADADEDHTADPTQDAHGNAIADGASQASSRSDDPVLARWFEGQRLADTDDNIFRAFEMTNGDLKLAAQLLVLWRRGRPTPRDVRGVFHEEHDAMLLGTDARAVRRVYELHGHEAADERLRRLDERYEDVGEDE